MAVKRKAAGKRTAKHRREARGERREAVAETKAPPRVFRDGYGTIGRTTHFSVELNDLGEVIDVFEAVQNHLVNRCGDQCNTLVDISRFIADHAEREDYAEAVMMLAPVAGRIVDGMTKGNQ